MKCISCKNTIPNGSKFCNFCGKKQIKEASSSAATISVPKPKRLKSGNWHIQLRINGQSFSITKTTEQACIDEAMKIKTKHTTIKRRHSAGDFTIGEAIDRYIASRDSILSPATIRGYNIIRNNRFKSIMSIYLRNAEHMDWQEVCNDECKICAPKTVKNAWGFVSTVLRTNGVSVPKVTLAAIPPSKTPYFTPSQIKLFVCAIKDNVMEIPALLALHGLRRSEIFGLDWQDIDMQKKMIYVKNVVVPDDRNKLVEKDTTKTQASTRPVPIMIDALYQALLKSERKTGPVAPIKKYECGRKVINRICRQNDLPEVGYHGLRHSFASLAYYLNFPERVTMQIGGWSDYKVMQDIYTHLYDEGIAKATSDMTEFYQNISGLDFVS